jgi:hypothetical protein
MLNNTQQDAYYESHVKYMFHGSENISLSTNKTKECKDIVLSLY